MEKENELKLLGLVQYYCKTGTEQQNCSDSYNKMVMDVSYNHHIIMTEMANWLKEQIIVSYL
jgi:hypothetical protein